MLFLTFIVNVLMMVYKSQDLLRASIVSAGNSHRLGANEAPPAILSIFLGRHLSHMLDEVVARLSDAKLTPDEKKALQLGIGRHPCHLARQYRPQPYLPLLLSPETASNSVLQGSSANCAASMIVIRYSHGSPTERIQGTNRPTSI